MSRRRLQIFSKTIGPLSLVLPHNDDERVGMQETTYEDSQSQRKLSRHYVESCTFYLPIDYKVLKILGRGAHGVVAAAIIASTDRPVAIKQIKLNLEPSCDDEENLYRWKSVYREVSLLRQLSEKDRHPNVIMLEDVFFIPMSNQYEIMLSTNLMETSLDALMKSRPLTNKEKQRYIHQIFYGLDYLHSNNIIHRDLKPANVLINGEKLCIADLGQARVGEILRDEVSMSICDDISASKAMTNHGVGTFIYRAPELHFNYPHYNCSVDQWSAGCIFGEMLLETKQTLFTGGEEGDNLFIFTEEVFRLIGTLASPDEFEWLPEKSAIFVRSQCSRHIFSPGWSRLSIADETTLDLLKKLLEFNPSGRITARKALQHNYFGDTDLPHLQVVPPFSSSSFTSTVELDRLTTTQQVRDLINSEIKQIKHNSLD